MGKKKLVKKFFELFIKNYLVGDILVLDKIKRNEVNACTIPQAMAVLTGMDLLGYLFGGNKDTNDTKAHFFEFFRITNNSILIDRYNEPIIDKLVLYRHGMMHHFFPNFKNEYIGICKSDSQDLFIQEIFKSVKVESLNVSVLTSDFLFSVSAIEELIEKNTEDLFFDNILKALPQIEVLNLVAPTTTNDTTACIKIQNKRNKK